MRKYIIALILISTIPVFGLDLLYSQKGFKSDIIFIEPSGEPIGPK